MNCLIKKVAFAATIILLASCSKELASPETKSLIDNHYNNLKEKAYLELYQESSSIFKDAVSIEEYQDLFMAAFSTLGRPLHYEIISAEDSQHKTGVPIKTIITSADYEHGKAVETLSYSKIDDEYRLHYYFIDSPQLQALIENAKEGK